MKNKPTVNEIDNGPRGRVQTDKINYGQTRNTSGHIASKDELAAIRASADAYKKQKLAAARGKIEKKPAKVDLDTVWSKVEDVVGQTVPDGDPIDWLAPWLERQGVKDLDISTVLTKAARKHGYRDIYEYYNEMMQYYNELQGEMGRYEDISEDDYQPQSALGKALWRDLGGKKQISQVQKKRNQERWAKNPHNPANKTDENTTEAKGVVDKNFGKVRKNDVVQTDLKPGDLVIGHTSPSTSVFGKVKRIGREHIFMLSNSGEEIAFLPQEIELLTKDYWLKKLDAESARRAKFRKESVELDEWANVVQGDMVNHHLLPKGGKVLKVSGNSVFVQDNATRKVLKLSILSLLRGNDMTEADQAQITNVQPGKSATVQTTADNNGVSQTMQIDLQKNPAALRKNPQTGKLELSLPQQNQQNKGPQGTIGTQGAQGTSQSSLAQEPIKTGDKVELTQMNDLKKLAGL